MFSCFDIHDFLDPALINLRMSALSDIHLEANSSGEERARPMI